MKYLDGPLDAPFDAVRNGAAMRCCVEGIDQRLQNLAQGR